MKLTRFIAAAMSAAIITSAALPCAAYAEQTVIVSAEYEAAMPKWDGESELKSGKKYSVSQDITITADTVIPAKTTLTVKKGYKLIIANGATLTVKGKLVVGEGATLTVNGGLTLNKNKTLDCSGKMKLGTKSVVKLNGRFTLRKEGTLSGKPKKITAGVDSVIKLYGENSCAKLDKAIEAALAAARTTSAEGKPTAAQAKKDAASLYYRFLNYLFVEQEALYACRLAYPDGVLEATLDESAFEDFGGVEKFARDYSISLSNYILKDYTNGRLDDTEEISSITLKFGDFYGCLNYISNDMRKELKEKFGDIDELWLADATITIKLKNGEKVTMDDFYVSFAYIGDQIYVATENYSEVKFS